MIICLDSPFQDCSCDLPKTRNGSFPDERIHLLSSTWSFSMWGLPCVRSCLWTGGLLHRRFTFIRPTTQRMSFLCGTFRLVVLWSNKPSCYEAQCPTELGLSSRAFIHSMNEIIRKRSSIKSVYDKKQENI